MTSLQTMIDQNNATVSFLQQQDFHNAVVSSSTAMALLQELVPQMRRSSPNIIDIHPAGANAPEGLDQCMVLFDVETIQTDPHLENTSFVYEQGIAIPSTAMKYEVVASILIFNSALAHQLYAQQQQDKATSRTYLLKSKRLYGLTLQESSDVDHNILFQFAIMNNIAVIEQQTGNTALSTLYFENLMSSTLMLLVDRGFSSRLGYLRGFLRNVPFKVGIGIGSIIAIQ